MALRARRTGGNGLDAWPGYVDALSTLLMVVMFVLLVFVLAQAFGSVVLAKRNDQLLATTQVLSREQATNAGLRRDLTAGDAARAALLAQIRDLNTQTANIMAERDDLAETLKKVERASAAAVAMNATLTGRAETAERALGEARARVAELNRTVTVNQERIAELDRTVTFKQETIDAKLSELARLMNQVASLTALRDSLTGQLETEKTDPSRAQVALLTQQVRQLRAELDASEARRAGEAAKADDLNAQLNLALAAQVEELRKSRSEFFGKLRTVLADKPGVTIAGDRFVFQSEVLFGVRSARLSPEGMAQMTDLAATIRDLLSEIPPDVHWILRVDGHTDSTPTHGAVMLTNWELSSARAISVVKFLIEQGIPAEHLAAAGFGEFQPVDPADTPEARAKNRRIEIRMTDR